MNNIVADSDKALWLLKNKGEMSLKELAQELNVTTEGARFQINKLAANNLVKSEKRSKGRGRPQQLWSLTAEGHSRFPDTHSDMTVKIIEKIRQNLGEDALDSVILSTSNDNISNYARSIHKEDSLGTRVKKLAGIREKEGYMAGFEENEDGSFTLFENHCPICAAATVCQGFCRAELRTFRNVLGNDVEVERTDHILAGARRCAYLIKEK